MFSIMFGCVHYFQDCVCYITQVLKSVCDPWLMGALMSCRQYNEYYNLYVLWF